MLSIKQLDNEQSKAIEEESSSYITISMQGKERRIDMIKYIIYKSFDKDLFLQSCLERSKKIIIRYYDNASNLTCFEVTV